MLNRVLFGNVMLVYSQQNSIQLTLLLLLLQLLLLHLVTLGILISLVQAAVRGSLGLLSSS